MLLEWYRDNADGSAEVIGLTKVTNVEAILQKTTVVGKLHGENGRLSSSRDDPMQKTSLIDRDIEPH